MASIPAETTEPRPANQTELCKHKESCLLNALRGFLRGALIGAGVNSALFLLSALASGKIFRHPAMLKRIIGGDLVRYTVFLSFLCGGYKSVLCLMRRVSPDDRKNSLVAGLVCSLGLLAMKGETKKTWALYLFVRALVSVHTSAVQKHWIPEIPYGVYWLFALVCTVLLYARAFEPDCLSKSYYNFISYMSAGTKNDTTMLDIFGKYYKHQELIRKGLAK
jgi:hypothetical protein